jgi:hypothetical protein
MKARDPITPADIVAQGKGQRLGVRRCSGPGCTCSVFIVTSDKARRSTAICDGSADVSGLGCGMRVFFPPRITAIWIDDHCAERALSSPGEASSAPTPGKSGGFL